MKSRKTLIAFVLVGGALGAGMAHARGGEVDVNWSVTIGTPHAWPVHVPAPVVVVPRAAVPAPRVFTPVAPARVAYREPTRWDVDGDGIPNRYDRLYNPRWDVDGDGIPNRYDRVNNLRWNADRDGDGIPNRYDRHPYRPGR